MVVAMARRVVWRPHETLALDDRLPAGGRIRVEHLRLRTVTNLDIETNGSAIGRALDRVQMVNERPGELVLATATLWETTHRVSLTCRGARNGV